jgi:hypothetical protein
MNMKEHILAALQEQFGHWEELLASLSEEQITAPQFDSHWSIKDVMAHLWAWQHVSVVRIEGGVLDREPDYPHWILSVGEDWEDNGDAVNALTFERNHHKPWSEIYQNWRNGFLRLMDVAEKISERDLLDGNRYPWLNGYNLASILVASYDHHQEHLEKLLNWLGEQEH